MNEKPEKLIDKKGIRGDGRKADELRPVKLQVGVLSNADGSAYIEHGKNKILAAAFGPREMHPKHLAQPDRMVLRCQIPHGTLLCTGKKISCTIQKRS